MQSPQTIRWPDKDPAEIFTVSFPYAQEIDVGETINGAILAVVLRGGTDSTPEAIIDGSLQISGSSILQRIRGGIDGANYGLRCDATTSTGRVLTRAAILPVRLAV